MFWFYMMPSLSMTPTTPARTKERSKKKLRINYCGYGQFRYNVIMMRTCKNGFFVFQTENFIVFRTIAIRSVQSFEDNPAVLMEESHPITAAHQMARTVEASAYLKGS